MMDIKEVTSMVYNFLIKKTLVIGFDINQNQGQLVEELHKPIIKKF